MSRKATVQPFSRLIAQVVVVCLVSLFTALSGCGGDGKNKKDQNPVPILTSIAPTSATVGGPAFSLTVTGLDFVAGSTVQWNGSGRPTTFVNGTQLSAAIPAADLAAPGTAQVTVVNPDAGWRHFVANHVHDPERDTCRRVVEPVERRRRWSCL